METPQRRRFDIIVEGRNPGKGSKKPPFVNPHTGRIVLVEENAAEKKAWERRAVAALKELLPPGQQPWRGPVFIAVILYYARPASQFIGDNRVTGKLRDDAPQFAYTGRPDGDKAMRLVWDAVTKAGVIADDVLVAYWGGQKRWSDNGKTYTHVTVILMDDGDYPEAAEDLDSLIRFIEEEQQR